MSDIIIRDSNQSPVTRLEEFELGEAMCNMGIASEADGPDVEDLQASLPQYGDGEGFAIHKTLGIGVLLECEIVHPDSDDPDDVKADAWNGTVPPAADVDRRYAEAVEGLQTRFPDAHFWLEQHGGIFLNRMAILAFVPQAKSTEETNRAIAVAIHDHLYGRAAA